MADGKTIPPKRTVVVVPLTERRRRGPSNDVIQKLSAIVADGNYYNIACAIVGVPTSTFGDWMRKGEVDEQAGFSEAESPYMTLSVTMKRAWAESQARMVHVVTEAGRKGNPIAATIFLERTDPARWARRDRKASEEIDDEQKPIERIEIMRPAPQVDSKSDSSGQ